MIERITKILIKWLMDNHAIVDNDRELYEYAVFNLILKLLPFTIILPFCMITKTVISGSIIIFVFLSIRSYSGGFHASTPVRCFIASCTIMMLIIISAEYINNHICLFAAMIFAVISLSHFSPLDSGSRRLELQEKKKYKIICIIMILFYIAGYIILTAFKQDKYAVCIALGVLLAAFLQVLAVRSSKKYDKNEHFLSFGA